MFWRSIRKMCRRITTSCSATTALANALAPKNIRTRYLRFKADESAQAITGSYRITHPEDNNERQSIHEHTSMVLK